MRFSASEDEVMVEDTLDRALKALRDKAPSLEGRAPRPDPLALRTQLSELGVWTAWLPEAAGGLESGPRLLLTLARCLGRVPSHHGLIGGSVLPLVALTRAKGPDAEELIARMEAGGIPAAVAAMEPGQRWTVSTPKMKASPVAGGYQLSGTKSHVAEGASAEAFIVSAQDGAGVSLFLVPADAEGLSRTVYPVTDGTKWAALHADAVFVPEAAKLVGPDDGAGTLEQAFIWAAFAAAAEILGSCEAALSQTLDYLRTREQFGKPLSANQALQFRAADLHTDIEMLRSQLLGAANALAQGDTPSAYADVAAAIALAVQTGDLVGREAIHLHGAIGMTRELGIGYHLLRVDVLSRWLGNAEHFRMKFMSHSEEVA